MTGYEVTVNSGETNYSFNLTEILSDSPLSKPDGSLTRLLSSKDPDSFVFYRIDIGTKSQQLIMWNFLGSDRSKLYIFSKSGSSFSPSGDYEGQCLNMPPQNEESVRKLLNPEHIEELVRRTVKLQTSKEHSMLTIRDIAA